MIAAISSGNSQILNFSTARDCASTLGCLRELGISIENKAGQLLIAGNQRFITPRRPLDCGNSGSTLRILAGVLAAHDLETELIGDDSLSSRPMRRIIEPLELMGAQIDATEGKAPLRVRGTSTPASITYKLPIASAQVKSAILFAALKAKGRTTVIETCATRDHTERLFNGFGVPVTTNSDHSVVLDGPARLKGGAITIPGDVSSAAYFVAAAMLMNRSDLTIEGVGLNPTRAAFLSVLSAWGANISTTDLQSDRNEPYGTISVSGISKIANDNEHTLSKSMIPSLIDELPLLAVVGSQISGGIRIRNAAELRLKESDRLASTAINLRAMGAEVEEFADGLHVIGPAKLRGATLDSFGDHRIAMAFTVAALVADGDTEINGADSVAISFPEFFDLLESVVVR